MKNENNPITDTSRRRRDVRRRSLAVSTHPQRSALTATLTALIMFHGLSGSAQDAGSDRATGTNDVVELSPVVVEGAQAPERTFAATNAVSAMKMPAVLMETPQSVSVITREQLEVQNVSTLAEALRYTPGIRGETFGFEPRLPFLNIRGFNSFTSGLFQDGMELRNPTFVTGYNPEIYGMERIEVARGPASVLYGAGNPGGLVNFVSKRPTNYRFGEAEFQVGNFNRYEGKLDLGGPIDDEGAFSYRLTGLGRDSDTQVDFVHDDRIFLAPSFSWQPREGTKLTVLTRFQQDSTRSSQRYPAAGTLTANPNGAIPISRFTGEPGVDQYDRNEWALGYLFEHETGGPWAFSQNFRYYNSQLDDRTIFTTSLMADNRTITRSLFESFGQLQGLALDNRARFDFATGPLDHNLLGGIDYQHVDADSLQTFGGAPTLDIYAPVYGAPVAPAPVFNNTETAQDQMGLYLMDRVDIAEDWVVSLGGRYDFAGNESQNNLTGAVTEQDDQAFTGRAGLLYRTEIGLAPYFNYSESFTQSLGADPAGNPFEPERGRQYELGVKYQPQGWRSHVTLSVFDVVRQNVVETSVFPPVQTGEIRSRGLELEAVADLGSGLNVHAGYTYLDAEITESTTAAQIGARPTQVPEHMASLWADYTVPGGPLKDLGLGGGVRYIGPRFGNTPNTLRIPGFTLADLAAHYTWDKLRFQVNVHNLFDRRYVGSAFPAGQNFAALGAARTVLGSISYSW